jgi:hypothetical protein
MFILPFFASHYFHGLSAGAMEVGNLDVTIRDCLA